MRTVFWTLRAQDDLAAIYAFISRDFPQRASLVVRGLIAAAGRTQDFPQAGRMVPEYQDPLLREVIRPPYRIVYRLVEDDEVHIVTVHHSAQDFPADL